MSDTLETFANMVAAAVAVLAVLVALAVWADLIRDNMEKTTACKANGGAYVQSQCVKVIE